MERTARLAGRGVAERPAEDGSGRPRRPPNPYVRRRVAPRRACTVQFGAFARGVVPRAHAFSRGKTKVFISEAFAQAAPAATASSESFMGSLGSMLPLLLMFVVLYFVMIRPQMKRQKEHKAMIDALAKGDEVVTGGGMIGKVSKMGDSYLHVEIANGVEVQVQRSAIVQVLPKGTVK
jgi:preprotein translocase subunit YajC